MIRPLIILNLMLKYRVIVIPWTDINDKVVISMVFLEIARYIFDWISICLFDEIRSRKSHSDNFISNVSQVKILPLIVSGILRTSNYFSNYAKHQELLIINIWTIIIYFNEFE